MKAEIKGTRNCDIEGEFLKKRGKTQAKTGNALGRERRIAAALGLAAVLGMTGCAGKEAAPEETGEHVAAAAGMQENATALESEWEREAPLPAQEKEAEQTVENDTGKRSDETAENGQTEGPQETVHLGGKVQEPRADGMTLAQTTLLDEDGQVTLLDEKDAKKIPVRFTEDTKVEHWTIQGGGAGIDMREAAVSDLESGMLVELEGYYEGETFVAAKVIMEEDA